MCGEGSRAGLVACSVWRQLSIARAAAWLAPNPAPAGYGSPMHGMPRSSIDGKGDRRSSHLSAPMLWRNSLAAWGCLLRAARGTQRRSRSSHTSPKQRRVGENGWRCGAAPVVYLAAAAAAKQRGGQVCRSLPFAMPPRCP